MSHHPPDFLDPARAGTGNAWIEFAGRVLVCARRVRLQLAVAAKQYGLSEPEIEMLWACACAPPGGRRQNELAQDLAVSPAHVSGIVERMRQAGLLQCSMVEGDRRLRCWRLAPAGQTIWQMLIDDSKQQGEAA